MSIGVDFILRANSSGFTRGLAQANNKLTDLKKGFRAMDFGRMFTGSIGVGAVIAAFSHVINSAQVMRDKLREAHEQIPVGTASVARYADSWDRLKDSVTETGVKTLSFFTQYGEAFGQYLNMKLGNQLVDSGVEDQAQLGADKQMAARAAAFNARDARNTGAALSKAKNDLKAAEEARAMAEASEADKVNLLLAKQIRLRVELSDLLRNPEVVANDQAAIFAKRKEIVENGKAVEDQVKGFEDKKRGAEDAVAKAKKAEDAAKRSLKDAQEDQFLPSLAELAAKDTHGATNDKRSRAILHARDVMKLEGDAAAAAGSERYGEAFNLKGKADAIRSGLVGFVKSDDTAATLRSLEDTSTETAANTKRTADALSGLLVIKATP